MNYILCDDLSDTNWQKLLVEELVRQVPSRLICGNRSQEEWTEHFEVNKARLFENFCQSYHPEREVNLIFTDLAFQFLPMYYSFLKNQGCVKVRFYGFAHGGFYEPWDIQRVLPAYSSIERQMFCYFTRIFVQTNYHRDLITLSYPELASRVHVAGMPVPQVRFERPKKTFEAAFFSRKSPDKGIDYVPEGVEVRRLPKTDYYNELSKYRAVLVPSRKETFGYVAVEAVLCGTLPVVPFDFSYPEIFGDSFIYFNDYSEIEDKLKFVCGLSDDEYFTEVERLAQRLRELRFEVPL
ncbi:MAG: hypothetical protein ACM3OC_07490 [Deltaproteobacteria bacterium]